MAGRGIQVAGEGIQGDFEGIRTSVRVFSVWAMQKNAFFTTPNASESGLEFLNYNNTIVEEKGRRGNGGRARDAEGRHWAAIGANHF